MINLIIKTNDGQFLDVKSYKPPTAKCLSNGTIKYFTVGVDCEFYFPRHEQQIKTLKDALHFDQTDLAKGLVALKKLCESYQWIREGRGPYAFNDDRYKQEVINILDKVEGIAKHTLQVSGAIAHSFCCDRELLNVTIEDIGYVKKEFYEERINKMKRIIEDIKKLEPPDDIDEYGTFVECYELAITTVTELLNQIPEL